MHADLTYLQSRGRKCETKNFFREEKFKKSASDTGSNLVVLVPSGQNNGIGALCLPTMDASYMRPVYTCFTHLLSEKRRLYLSLLSWQRGQSSYSKRTYLYVTQGGVYFWAATKKQQSHNKIMVLVNTIFLGRWMFSSIHTNGMMLAHRSHSRQGEKNIPVCNKGV